MSLNSAKKIIFIFNKISQARLFSEVILWVAVEVDGFAQSSQKKKFPSLCKRTAAPFFNLEEIFIFLFLVLKKLLTTLPQNPDCFPQP